MKRRIVLLGLALTLLYMVTGVGLAHDEGIIAKAQAKGVLTVGMAVTKPFCYKTPSGEWTGLDVDIANLLAQELGVKLKIVESNFSNLIAGLQAKKFDIAFVAMFQSPKRAMVVDFTRPYTYLGVSVLLNKNETRIKTWRDLNNPDYKVAVNIGAIEESVADKWLPKAKKIRISSTGIQQTALEVQSGRADACLADAMIIKAYIKENSWAKTLNEPPFAREGIGYAVRPGNEHLLRFLNLFLDTLEDNGTLEALTDKWL